MQDGSHPTALLGSQLPLKAVGVGRMHGIASEGAQGRMHGAAHSETPSASGIALAYSSVSRELSSFFALSITSQMVSDHAGVILMMSLSVVG